MPFPQVVAVAPGSPAELAGVRRGDELRSVNGTVPSDVIEYRLLCDEPDPELELSRGGMQLQLIVAKQAGEPLGLEVSSAVFDRVRTCDNHCAFCFIYQLPKGMRRSLYVKDDDYRLSFLYGNFTTLTRFTELDLERVVTERLSPLYVSIHATDPNLRARLLRNRRGATSLRFLSALLDHGIEVHGQLVICPGQNDGAALEDTLAGILERFWRLASAAAVPLGVSRYSHEAEMRPHTPDEAAAVLATVHAWQRRFRNVLGRRMVFAADEYYLLAGEPFPGRRCYEGFPQLENGVGMAAAFEGEFAGPRRRAGGGEPGGGGGEPGGGRRPGGFFASVDGAPASGYRAVRLPAGAAADRPGAPGGSGRPCGAGIDADRRPVTIVTGEYGAAVLAPLLARYGYGEVEVMPVRNGLFGGNIAVTGLLGGADVLAALQARRDVAERRFLLPDVCLSEGRFLDGVAAAELPPTVEIVASDGGSLRAALDRGPAEAAPPRALPARPVPATAVSSRPVPAPAAAGAVALRSTRRPMIPATGATR